MAQHYFNLGVAPLHKRGWPSQFPQAGQPDPNDATYLEVASSIYNGERALTVKRADANEWHNVSAGVTHGDIDVLLKMMHKGPSISSYVYTNTGGGLYLRSDVSGGATGAGYYVSFGSPFSYDKRLSLYRREPSGQTLLAAEAVALSSRSEHEVVRSPKYIRVLMEGSRIRAKAWWADEAEPSSWGIDETDSTYASGELGLMLHGYLDYQFFTLSVGTNGDPAPSPPQYQVTGSVTGENGNFVERRVVALHREAGIVLGEAISDPLTGAWSIALDGDYPLTVIAFDESSGTKNALIYDRVIPEPTV